jgi:hypothetical protein
MAAGVVHIPWYATFFRGDAFDAALGEISQVSLRYGATDYRVYRSRDDAYKFLQMFSFEDKTSWEAFWYGPEFVHMRGAFAGYYQVPVLYVWHDLVHQGGLVPEPAAANGE